MGTCPQMATKISSDLKRRKVIPIMSQKIIILQILLQYLTNLRLKGTSVDIDMDVKLNVMIATNIKMNKTNDTNDNPVIQDNTQTLVNLNSSISYDCKWDIINQKITKKLENKKN